jgi:hypothetical protein
MWPEKPSEDTVPGGAMEGGSKLDPGVARWVSLDWKGCRV